MSKRDHAGVLAPPPLIVGGFFLLAWGLHGVLPLSMGRSPILVALGWIFGGLGLVLAGWAAGRLFFARTAVLPHHRTTALVFEPPYSFSRNPIYLGLILMYCGGAFLLSSLWPLVLLPAVIWVLQVGVIRREEEYLARIFGDVYEEYRARVGRWL
jgi:protein-S-isoprenylcysteine O-methyltransferase Ste14